MLRSSEGFGKIRNHISGKLEMLTYDRILCGIFNALICGVLDSLLQTTLQEAITLIKYKINTMTCNLKWTPSQGHYFL